MRILQRSLEGSLNATAITGSSTALSSSLAGRTTTLEGNVGQAVNTTSDVTFDDITATGNISGSATSTLTVGTGSIKEDLTLGGSLTMAGSGINITNDSSTELNFNGTNNTNITTAGNLFIKAGSSKKLYLGANATDQQVTLDTNGNFGIGTTSPGEKLEVIGNISASATSTGSFARVEVATSISLPNDSISGDKIEGGTIGSTTITDLTATKLNVTHFTSSFITSSTIQTEGSNTFGDTIADQHTFNGHITASGNISSSGTGIFNKLEIHGADGILAADYILHKGDENTKFGFPSNDHFKIRTAGTDRYVVDTVHQFTGDITADSNISSSATSTGSFGRVEAIGTLSAEHIVSSDDLIITDDLSVGGDSTIGTLLNFKTNNESTIRLPGAGGGNVHGVDLIISGANASSEGSARDGGDVIILSGRKAGAGAEGNILLNPHQGLVGIGTSNPTEALQVTGDISP